MVVNVLYPEGVVNRYMAIAHTRNDGGVEYANILDNVAIRTDSIEGDKLPQWLLERAAMLRMCDINYHHKGEAIGRKFTDHMMYVYLTYDEYNELKSQAGVQK